MCILAVAMAKSDFGETLRNLRLRKKIGLRELSRKAGIDHTRLSKIEHGLRPPPELELILSLARALGTDPHKLAQLAGVPKEFLKLNTGKKIMNVLQGQVVGKSDHLLIVKVANNELEIAGEKPKKNKVKITIRPEEITLYKRPESLVGTSARNRFSGTITGIEPHKTYNYATLQCGGFKLKVAVTDKSIQKMGLKPGSGVYATFKATAAKLSAV